MKKMLVSLLVLFISASLFAQSDKEDIEFIQSLYGKEKKALVAEYMKMDEPANAKFWALYDEYETERKKIGAQRLYLLEEYADKYDSLDDKTAIDLTTRVLKLNQSYLKFQEKYLKKFTSAIGGLNASKFFQLENYLETAVRLSIQDEIPFIGDLDAKRKTED